MAAFPNAAQTGTPVTQMPEISAVSAVAVLTNGATLFTAVGDVQILNLFSECITANGASATTLQYSITPTVGSATTISGASSSLANAVAGTLVSLVGDALATAPIVSTTSVGLAQTARGIVFMEGVLTTVVGTGPSTGTWKHYMRYRPLQPGAYVY